jgi:hypothetical protein
MGHLQLLANKINALATFGQTSLRTDLAPLESPELSEVRAAAIHLVEKVFPVMRRRSSLSRRFFL